MITALDILWKAIEEQNEKIDSLSKDVDRLSEQNSFLLKSLKSGILLPVINQEELVAAKKLAVNKESIRLATNSLMHRHGIPPIPIKSERLRQISSRSYGAKDHSPQRSYILNKYTYQITNNEPWQDVSLLEKNDNHHNRSMSNYQFKSQISPVYKASFENFVEIDQNHRQNSFSRQFAQTKNHESEIVITTDVNLPKFTSECEEEDEEELLLEKVKLMDLYNANLRFSHQFYDNDNCEQSDDGKSMTNNNNSLRSQSLHHLPDYQTNDLDRKKMNDSVLIRNSQNTLFTKQLQRCANHPGFTKLSSLIKGHLTRKIFRSHRVQETIGVLKETNLLLNQAQSWNDNSLKLRLKNQMRASLMQIHEIFFEWPLISRLRLIVHDETYHRNKRRFENNNTKIISSATIKRLEEKQIQREKKTGRSRSSSINSKSCQTCNTQKLLSKQLSSQNPPDVVRRTCQMRVNHGNVTPRSTSRSSSIKSLTRVNNSLSNFTSQNKCNNNLNTNVIRKRIVSRGTGTVTTVEKQGTRY